MEQEVLEFEAACTGKPFDRGAKWRWLLKATTAVIIAVVAAWLAYHTK